MALANDGVNSGQVCDPNSSYWTFGGAQAFRTQFAQADQAVGLATVRMVYGGLAWNKDTSGGCSSACPPLYYKSYNDVVMKIYQHYQGLGLSPTRVEIWNEPDYSGNGGYMSATTYATYYQNVAQTIRSLDSTVPIGGPVTSTGGNFSTWTDAMHNAGVPSSVVNFFVYHNYSTGNNPTLITLPSYYGNIPAFVTEWNYDPGGCTLEDDDGSDSVSFVGNYLLDFLDRGWGGDYYASTPNGGNFFPIWAPSTTGSCPPPAYSATTLQLKARAFYLLSVDLGLGAGNSQIVQQAANSPGSTSGTAALNSAGNPVEAAVNYTASNQTITFQFNNVPYSGTIHAYVYLADHGSNTGQLVSTQTPTVVKDTVSVAVRTTPYSVAGVELAP
jgi:Glycosyl hydrolases family 39